MKLFHVFTQIYFKESLEGLSTMCYSVPLSSQPNRVQPTHLKGAQTEKLYTPIVLHLLLA